MRVKLNTGAFGMDLSATGTNRFLFAVDGEQNSADFTLNVNGSAGDGGLVSGATFASVVQGCYYKPARVVLQILVLSAQMLLMVLLLS